MRHTLSFVIADGDFSLGRGATEFELHNKLSTYINEEVNSRLSGRDINFVITVETRRDHYLPETRTFEVNIFD